ncbi:MAG: RagB/SusD family nutrient uptake outer membrane protein [Bacteroidales bacterium]|nr:RagB/SusD family nutrient uptake outer membrane protein [Bacteroidales bacterium]
MKIFKHITIVSILGLGLFSCEKDFLEVKNVDTGVTIEDLYTRYSQIQGVLWEAYSYLPDGLGMLWRDAATDIAEATTENNKAQSFNLGIWNQFYNLDDAWGNNFRGIAQVNKFLKNKDKVTLEEIKANSTAKDSTAYFKALNNMAVMEGEAYFLKAFFYFELVKRYGGVPIIDEDMDYYNESTWKNIPRSSLNECMAYIVSLCDKATGIIPVNVRSTYSWYEDGRATYGAAKTLRAKALLYAASPLYKAGGSTTTWADAARAANVVIGLKQYNLNAGYAALFGADNSNLKEIIFKRRYGSINWLEKDQYPVAFAGTSGNSLAPTQNFVDEFEVVADNGGNISSQPFDWSNPTHAADPYTNRDSRFEATIVFNGSAFASTTVETFIGGGSGLPKLNASKTGYYLKKWVNDGIDLVNGTTANHTWIYFRYADVLLMYAEAMLNAYGPDADPEGYGMTATEAFNMVRKRAGVEQLPAGRLNQERIEKERMVELAFEDQRFWDVHRWQKGVEYFNKPVTRIEITRNGSDFNYSVKELENRVFLNKMHWYPIPQDEISKTGWAQNPDW